MHVLAPFERRLTSADGTARTREFKAGDVVWMDAQTHVAENVGTTDTHVLIVQLKEPRPAPVTTPC